MLYREPLNPTWSAASVACHESVEVLQRIAWECCPVVKTGEVSGEGMLQGARGYAGGYLVSISFEPGW